MSETAETGRWDEVGREWRARDDDHLWRCCSDAIHQRWLERVAPALGGGTILKTDLFDEAFGAGLVDWFAERGMHVAGCDLAQTTARWARSRRHCRSAVVADVRSLPFARASFDCVLSNSTLDHFTREQDLRRALAEVAAVLKPGGTLLLTMDNPRHPLVYLRNRWPAPWLRSGVVPYAVGLTYSAPRLEEMLRESGFDTVDRTTILHSPRVLLVALCRWLARRRRWRTPPPAWITVLGWFESLATLPTRQITGHFVAIVARRTA